MRVLHIIKAKQIGGAERHLLILLPALADLGIEAHLLLIVEPDHLMAHLVEEARTLGISTSRVPIHGHLDAGLVPRLRDAIQHVNPDIVHSHLIHADTFSALAMTLRRGLLVSTRHNDDDFRQSRGNRWLQRTVGRRATTIIAISDAVRQVVVEAEGFPAERVHRVHYGFPYRTIAADELRRKRAALLAELRLPTETILLGTVSRLTEQKGISSALRAAQPIIQADSSVHFVVAGDGPSREALENLVEELAITEQVHFLGWREDAVDVIGALDIFLMPSLWEGFGLTLLEAMSQRRPIIASRVSAIPEIVYDEETGLLVPPRDSSAMTSALQRLLDDPALRAHFGLMGAARLQDYFTVERMARQTLDVYHGVLHSS